MVTNFNIKIGVDIISNIVHLIVFTRSDILLFHGKWLKELYSHEFRIDADIIVFSVFTSLFLLAFRGSFNISNRIISKISNYGCFSKFEVENGVSFAWLCYYFIHIVHIVWDIFYLNKTTRVDSPTLPLLCCKYPYCKTKILNLSLIKFHVCMLIIHF